MKAYGYNPDTGEYVGKIDCQPDPMNRGQYLTPANATTIGPPVVGDHKVVVFRDGTWITLDDFRGTKYWIEDTLYEIKQFGEKPPADAAYEKPLNFVRRDRIRELKDKRNMLGESPITVNNITVDADNAARENIQGAIENFDLVSDEYRKIRWTVADNTDINATLEMLQDWKQAIVIRKAKLHAHCRMLEHSIMKSTNPEAVNIDQGWPE